MEMQKPRNVSDVCIQLPFEFDDVFVLYFDGCNQTRQYDGAIGVFDYYLLLYFVCVLVIGVVGFSSD